MKTMYVTVEKNDDGYTIYTENGLFSGFGETLSDAKKEFIDGIDFYKEVMREKGKTYPDYLNDINESDIKFKFEVQSLLNSYEKILGLTSLSTLTGINVKQMWKYAHGKAKPQEKQKKKIEESLHRLGEELISISF